MNEISRKIGNVADFPLKLNLQLFADGTPELENTPEFKEDLKEYSAMEAKLAKFTEERQAKEPAKETAKETPKEADAEIKTDKEPAKEVEKAATPEVATPDDKPKQDSETNKAFQEMRQKLEAAEKAKTDIEARAKRADALIAAQFGAQGITTVEQYEQWIKQGEEEADNKRYQEAGLKPEEIEKLRKYDELQRESEADKSARQQNENTQRWQSLYTSYPELVESSNLFNEGKDPEWYNDEMKALIANGSSPRAAYRDVHFETILQNRLKDTKEVAKQEALNQLNSKEHIKPNATTGGDVDHVEIDDDTMRMYRQLNKGKTDAQIRAWHKKNTG